MITIDKAIEILKENFERAQKLEYVKRPLAWALYQTWKRVEDNRPL